MTVMVYSSTDRTVNTLCRCPFCISVRVSLGELHRSYTHFRFYMIIEIFLCWSYNHLFVLLNFVILIDCIFSVLTVIFSVSSDSFFFCCTLMHFLPSFLPTPPTPPFLPFVLLPFPYYFLPLLYSFPFSLNRPGDLELWRKGGDRDNASLFPNCKENALLSVCVLLICSKYPSDRGSFLYIWFAKRLFRFYWMLLSTFWEDYMAFLF